MIFVGYRQKKIEPHRHIAHTIYSISYDDHGMISVTTH